MDSESTSNNNRGGNNAGRMTNRQKPSSEKTMWRKGMEACAGTFWTAFFIGYLAVSAQAIANGFGYPPLSALAYGFGHTAILLGTGLAFTSTMGWHNWSLSLTLAHVFCDSGRKFSLWFLFMQLGMALVAAGGYAAAQGINFAIYGFSLFDSSTITSEHWFADMLNEFVGELLICFIFIMSMRRYEGVWGVLGISFVYGMLVMIYQPANGGSFNWTRTFITGLIEGNLSLTGVTAKLVGAVVAPIIACFTKIAVFPEFRPATRSVRQE